MADAAQTMAVATTVPTEEDLIGAENTGDTIHWDVMMYQYFNIVAPKLVFDKESLLGASGTNEATCIQRRIERKIAHHIGIRVVLAHFIARGREESKQNFLLWVFSFETFHERTALFKLAERCSMEPNVRILSNFLFEYFPGVFLASHQSSRFRVEQREDFSTDGV